MSVDSQFVHKIWQERELSKMTPGGVPYPMLSDAGGKVGTMYGVYDEEKGVNIRGRFLIDPDGIIQAIEMLTPPVGRNVAELIRQLQAFQHHRKTGEVTPSGWYPGRMALKPSPDLAGRVWEKWRPQANEGGSHMAAAKGTASGREAGNARGAARQAPGREPEAKTRWPITGRAAKQRPAAGRKAAKRSKNRA